MKESLFSFWCFPEAGRVMFMLERTVEAMCLPVEGVPAAIVVEEREIEGIR